MSAEGQRYLAAELAAALGGRLEGEPGDVQVTRLVSPAGAKAGAGAPVAPGGRAGGADAGVTGTIGGAKSGTSSGAKAGTKSGGGITLDGRR